MILINGHFIANVVIGIVSFCLLWSRGRDLFFETPNDEILRIDRAFAMTREEGEGVFGRLNDDIDFSLVNTYEDDTLALRIRDFLSPACVSAPSHQLGSPLNKNINMVSAICHLSNDTFKAIGSLVAGLTALYLDLDLLQCYAWSCVGSFVVVLVVVVVPLAKEILGAARELRTNHGLYRQVTEDEDIDKVVY